MALVTVQRSPCNRDSPQRIDSTTCINIEKEVNMGRNSKSLSECYFAGKGTALVLPAAAEALKCNRRFGADTKIQRHLQSMFYLLRAEETLKMAVKLESAYPARTRYLVVVSRMGARAEESCLLGIDCNQNTTVGLVLKVLADTAITLDGDGGFSVTVCGRHHIFKPVSVQAMWSALQTLHKVSSKAREQNYFQGGLTHSWVNYYEERIQSDRSCLNEWNAMDNLESRRPPSPDSLRTKPTEREKTEQVIKSTLKEVMMSVDLDEVTSKYIRSHLEEDYNMDLGEYKSFIDQEMLTILGQMDAPTEIFEHVYLGSEWNASNYEELQRNGVGHILNVTREIDNFFPGTFDYLNVRVYDDEKTDLLRHWDNTFKYITNAKRQGSKVLVHCKMGVSRSASVVIAYAMKAYNWNFAQAIKHVKEKRSCIKPNSSFLSQLETYQGILDAMKNKEKLQRSKSDTNLKSPGLMTKNEVILARSEPTPLVKIFACTYLHTKISGQDLRQLGIRPKSWSSDSGPLPNDLLSETKTPPIFRSLENIKQTGTTCESLTSKYTNKSLLKTSARNVLLPCDNGESYSVSPNQIMHIPNRKIGQPVYLSSVKERVNELEAKKTEKKLVLNLMPQFEHVVNQNQPSRNSELDSSSNNDKAQAKLTSPKPLNVKTETWDPGEMTDLGTSYNNGTINDCDLICSASDEEKMKETLGSTVPEIRLRAKYVMRKDGDMFSDQVDRVFEREERKQQRITIIPTSEINEDMSRKCPSRQSSWSSYDSAVGLGYQGETRQTPSRHSSWGSGDTRMLPSRNSSWGSYDMRNGNEKQNGGNDLIDNSTSGIFPYDKEDIPWNPGTVKRTKQKLEENSKHDDTLKSSTEAIQESETIQNDGVTEHANKVLLQSSNCFSNLINISNTVNLLCSNADKEIQSRLSVSAPEKSNMELIADSSTLSRSALNIGYNIVSTLHCSSVKQHKTFLDVVHNNIAKKDDFPELETNSGIVQIRKKEFEAKNSVEQRVQQMNISNSQYTEGKNTPYSPTHFEKPASPTFSDPGENVKELLGKFENKSFTSASNPYSCVEVSVDKSPVRIKQTPLITNYGGKSTLQDKNDESEFKRPPMVPVLRNALPNLVHGKTNNKKQQQFGKSHPLAKLNINKQRHNALVYNTM